MRLASLLCLLLAACPTPPPQPPPEPDLVPQQQTYSARGLWTYPNNLSELPDGAFARADNAVIRRQGIVETRRGYAPLSATFGSSNTRLNTLSSFISTLVGHTSANTVVRYDGSAWAAYSGTYTPPTGHRMRFVQSAKSLYFTTTEGVKRVDEVTGNVYPAGVPQATGGTVALDSNGAHATGTVTLGGGAGNVTVTVGGTAVGPVAFNTSDTQTAADTVTALNANATVSALVTATSVGPVITLTAVNAGTAGNSITLSASRTAGTATASGATLTGGNDGSGWFPANAQTAYRFVWGLRNANDRVILGAPSGRLSLTNPSTETLDTVSVTVSIPSWVTTEHFLQVYRADASALATVPAGDDMGLVYEVYPTQTEITARSLAFTDVTPDELKGAPLYSSPNAGIPGSEKFQPPVCTDLAEYKERVWCSATTQRQRLLLTLLSVDSSSGGMSNTDTLHITHADGLTESYEAAAAENAALGIFKRYTDGTATQNVANTTLSLIRVINSKSLRLQAFYISGEFDSPGQIALELRDLGGDEFVIRANTVSPPTYWTPAIGTRKTTPTVSRTGGITTVTVSPTNDLVVGSVVRIVSWSDPADEVNFPAGPYTITSVGVSSFTYADPLPDATAVDIMTYATFPEDLSSEPTDQPNGLAYAEYAEGADAVPLGNYLSVGSANHAILRIITLGDTLFVFKEEATYILTGDTPETFSVRQFPTPAKLLAPESAVVLGNSIYALMDQGVMVFTEAGAQVISRPLEGDLLPLYSGNAAMLATLKSTAFGVSYETEREYHLFLPSNTSSTYATQAYVYNYATQAWTRWDMAATCGYVLPSNDLEYLGRATSNTALQERKTRTTADYQDATGTPITMTVDWVVRTAGDPGGYKNWQKATVMLEPTGPTSVTLSVDTEISAASASGAFTVDGLPYITTFIPEEQQRSQVLTVGVSGGQVSKLLAIKGLAVDVLVPSTRVR